MTVNPDSPDKTGEKADLYSIIKRRKKTAADFIKQHEVTTLKEYKALIKQLEEKFILSDEFLKDSKKAVSEEKKFKNETTKPRRKTTAKKRITKTNKESSSKKITTSLSGSDIQNN